MASLAWVWTFALHRVIWDISQYQNCTNHWVQSLRIWWVLITNSVLKNEATGGGSFSFFSCLFIISLGTVFSFEPCWSQYWCLPASVTSSHEGRAVHLHTPYGILQQILKTSKSLNGCLQTTQDCKTLPINKTWKCSHHILSFKFRVSLWNMDLQKREATQRFAAEGIQQMLFLEEGFCSCASFCSCLLLLTWQTQFMLSSYWLKTCQSSASL